MRLVLGWLLVSSTFPLLGGCSTTPRSSLALLSLSAPVVAADSGDESTKGHSWPVALLLYVPNRVVDVLDLVRAGVSVGPGIGLDARATELAQAVMMSRLAAGLGYETLRHLPIMAGKQTEFIIGPSITDPSASLNWFKSATDLRVEVHALLVGAHAAIDPGEIFDLVVGFIGIDPKGDDF